MTKRADLEYHRPRTVDEALSYLARPGARIIAGGTDLMIDIKSGHFKGKSLVDVSGIEKMSRLRAEDGLISIGAAVKIEEIRKSALVAEKIPALALACDKFAGHQIRNQATIGGNVGHAAPCGDTHPPLILYDGLAEIASWRGRQTRPVGELFAGPNASALNDGELVTRFLLKPDAGNLIDFQKIGRRKDLAISRVSLAVLVALDEKQKVSRAKIVLGACMPTTRRMPQTESALIGQAASLTTFREAAKVMAAEMIAITGRRASLAYKEPAIGGLLLRVLSPLASGSLKVIKLLVNFFNECK
jgi:carbon-monoxide dehydrogenase medium subunit/xanthine dehydrogenase FAD-binding subunit